MKKFLLLIAAAMSLLIIKTQAQSIITVSGDITSNTTWSATNIYVLSGFVYVTNNAVLTIAPGTIIKGDKASKGSLIVTRGSRIVADGQQTAPIVFTSNEPAGSRAYGDWGGIIICGRAPINDPAGEKVIEGGVDAVKGLYGGNIPNDTSGILRYVRIEFSGIAFMPNNEINGLTLGGVGSGTVIDYIQVSYNGDDSYECFGGNVNMKHLISFAPVDDHFDTDFGYSGRNQFLVALSDSNVADVSGSNGFESDNDATGSTNIPVTHPVYSNVSLIGPMITSGTVINANYKRAAHLRRSAKTSIFNSVLAGFPTGLLIDGANSETNASNGELVFRNNIIAGSGTPLAVASGSTWDISAWFNTAGYNNSILPNSTDIMLTSPYAYNYPDFVPMGGSPLLSGADFSHAMLTDPFFEQVNYRGAFGSDNWLQDWTNFDPQNSNYILSVNENTVVSNLELFPNPVKHGARLNFSLDSKAHTTITLSSIEGRLVKVVSDTEMEKGKHQIDIPVAGLSGGIYLLNISNDKGTKSEKLIVL